MLTSNREIITIRRTNAERRQGITPNEAAPHYKPEITKTHHLQRQTNQKERNFRQFQHQPTNKKMSGTSDAAGT